MVATGWTAVALVCTLAAGCIGPGASGTAPASIGGLDGDLGAIRVQVVDLEIVPVEVADVSIVGTPFLMQTDGAGQAFFAQLSPGEYVIAVSKQGYAETTGKAFVSAGEVASVAVTLTAIASNVPYHDTQVFVALLDCSWAAAGATFPCVPIDRVTGQNITGDESAWRFTIPASGLANVLHEMTWNPQPTGREMKVVMTPPNQPVFVGGVSAFYMLNQGPSPLRMWLTPGVVAAGGSIPFDGNESTPYSAYIRGSERNNTAPLALYIEQRAENWFTFFYNRAGSPEYTALPDV
jgi:hypothetical protein